MQSQKPLLKAVNKIPQANTPIWLMRQAGRYLPEYKKIRAETKNFIEAVLTPEIASEITLQPIRRFDLDAAIVFSDILILPYAMGIDVEFREGVGPIMNYDFFSPHSILNTNCTRFHDAIQSVCRTISIVKNKLHNSHIATIGFAGGPWTVICYMLESHRKNHDFSYTKSISYNHNDAFNILLDTITNATIDFLLAQIEAGAEIVQIFDSHAGILSEYEFEKFVIQPTAKIVHGIRKIHQTIPIIGFPRKSGIMYQKFIEKTNVNCISIDHTVPLSFIKTHLQNKIAVQGNLNNLLLTLEHAQSVINLEVDNILMKLNNASVDPFIFNLGHGCLPETKIANIELMIKRIRDFQKN